MSFRRGVSTSGAAAEFTSNEGCMRSRRRARVIIAALASAAISACELMVQIAQRNPDFGARTAFLIPIPFMFYMIWRTQINPYVEFRDHDVLVNNTFTRFSIPYFAITEVKGNRSLSLTVAKYGHIPVLAFDAGVAGKKSRDVVAKELRARMHGSVPLAGVGLSKVFTVGIPEFSAAACTLLLVLFTYLG